MITVGYLKKRLETIDDDALVYAYEGEITGIIIVRKGVPFSHQIAEIYACEANIDQDGQEKR